MESDQAPWRVLEAVDESEIAGRPASGPTSGPTGGEHVERAFASSGQIRLVAVVAAAALLIAGAGALLLTAPRPAAILPPGGSVGAGGSLAGDPIAAEAAIVIDVGGAVVHPGVYRLPPGSRIADAIAAAGGFTARVDAAGADRQLNLAALLKDGDEVRIPSRDDPRPTAANPGTAGAAGSAGGPIDINSASAEQLDTLPGIGPVTAAKIIAAREKQPFRSVDELQSRKLVGPATYEKLRQLVTVR
jgi:competence protein ComEA